MFQADESKNKLYEGLRKHFGLIPKWIVCRTVELSTNSTNAFDALYDYEKTRLPVSWCFEDQRWVKEKIRLD
jgi:hypothetical protein